MNKDEFLNYLNESFKGINEFHITKDKFRNDLSSQLIQFILHINPEIQNCSALLDELKEAAEICAMMAFETLQRTYDRQDSGEPYKPFNIVPKIKSREKSLDELNEFLKLFPEIEYSDVEQDHWKEYEYDKQTQQFKIDIHNLVKKVLVEHFEEEILQFSSDCFYYFDEHIYKMATSSFIEKAFEFVE